MAELAPDSVTARGGTRLLIWDDVDATANPDSGWIAIDEPTEMHMTYVRQTSLSAGTLAFQVRFDSTHTAVALFGVTTQGGSGTSVNNASIGGAGQWFYKYGSNTPDLILPPGCEVRWIFDSVVTAGQMEFMALTLRQVSGS